MSSIAITINGHKTQIQSVVTLEDLLAKRGVNAETHGVAVALNESVVPKARWGETALREGDTIEVIHAVQGG